MLDIYEDIHFRKQDYSTIKLARGTYENCVFSQCNFNDSYLDNSAFHECEFRDCDLSNANLGNTQLREVLFEGCKLLGVHFYHCDPLILSFQFKGSTLDYASFLNLSIPGTLFENCSLRKVDFSGADLNRSRFDNSTLQGATFEETCLTQCDFRTAREFVIDPGLNRLRKAKFSRENLGGLLEKYEIIIE